MKKSEANVTRTDLDNSQLKVDAPVRLTPEELEGVAAGFMLQFGYGRGFGSTATTGLFPAQPVLKLK